MFGNPVENNLGWKKSSLSKLTFKIGSGATPRGGRAAYIRNGISLVRSMNVYDGLFVYDNLAFISDEQARKLDNVVVEKDDIFLNITGASVARSCIVPINVVNDTLRMYKSDDIRMYNFDCITDTIVEVITTCNTYTLLTVHLL